MSCTYLRNVNNNSPWLSILQGHEDLPSVNVHFFKTTAENVTPIYSKNRVVEDVLIQ